jgi:hypothetical protein
MSANCQQLAMDWREYRLRGLDDGTTKSTQGHPGAIAAFARDHRIGACSSRPARGVVCAACANVTWPAA